MCLTYNWQFVDCVGMLGQQTHQPPTLSKQQPSHQSATIDFALAAPISAGIRSGVQTLHVFDTHAHAGTLNMELAGGRRQAADRRKADKWSDFEAINSTNVRRSALCACKPKQPSSGQTAQKAFKHAACQQCLQVKGVGAKFRRKVYVNRSGWERCVNELIIVGVRATQLRTNFRKKNEEEILKKNFKEIL